MPTTLQDISFAASLAAKMTDTKEGQPVSATFSKSFGASLTHGAGAGKAEFVVADEARVLVAATPEDLDLFDLVGFGQATDALGNAVTFDKIKAILIRNRSVSVGSLLIGGKGTAAAWDEILNNVNTSKLLIPPDSFLMIGVTGGLGLDVTDTTNHILTIEASGGAATYDIYLVGDNG